MDYKDILQGILIIITTYYAYKNYKLNRWIQNKQGEKLDLEIEKLKDEKEKREKDKSKIHIK